VVVGWRYLLRNIPACLNNRSFSRRVPSKRKSLEQEYYRRLLHSRGNGGVIALDVRPGYSLVA
jgi:hypothetical protein